MSITMDTTVLMMMWSNTLQNNDDTDPRNGDSNVSFDQRNDRVLLYLLQLHSFLTTKSDILSSVGGELIELQPFL